MKELYAEDEDYAHIWDQFISHKNAKDFLIQDRYLFKTSQLYIRDLHGGGLGRYIGRDKTKALLAIIKQRFAQNCAEVLDLLRRQRACTNVGSILLL